MKCILTFIVLLIAGSSFGQQFRLQKILFRYTTAGPIARETHFYYPGNRGSDYKNGIINYDSAVSYSSWPPLTWQKKTYDTADRVLTDQSEALGAAPYYHSINRSYTYDSLGRVAKTSYSESEHRHDPYYSYSEYVYDSANLLIEINAGGSGRLALPQHSPAKVVYRYDSAGNRVSAVQQYLDTVLQAYVSTRKDSFVYDANNLMTVWRQEEWKKNAWQLMYKYDDTYAASNTKPVEVLLSFYDTGAAPYHFTKFLITYNSLGDTSELLVQGYKQSGFYIFSKKTYTYNAYDQPDLITEYWWDTTSSTWRAPRNIYQFIYEIYWPTTVAEPAQLAETQLYPNPAASQITIAGIFKAQHPFRATIYDMQGRILQSWSTPPGRNYHRTVDVSNLPPGNYVLTLSGSDVNASSRFSIVR